MSALGLLHVCTQRVNELYCLLIIKQLLSYSPFRAMIISTGVINLSCFVFVSISCRSLDSGIIYQLGKIVAVGCTIRRIAANYSDLLFHYPKVMLSVQHE